MSSQPNQSLIDGIRCLQYLVSSGKAVGCRELARQLGMNATRVNRLLLTMASIGLTMQDEQRRYLPGPNIHALAAQAIRGSSLFSSALPVLEHQAPKDIIVAMGVLWEQQVIYIYHSKPGSLAYQALAGFHTLQAHESVIGMALLAGKDDATLRAQYSDEILTTIAPYLAQQREQQRVIWHHEDGEISIAMPVGKNQAALAFAGIYDATPEQIAQRELQLGKLVNSISAYS